MLAATLAAAVVAVALYYAHFIDTYRTELARIGAETATAAPDAGGRGICERLASVPRYLRLYFGVPAILAGARRRLAVCGSGARATASRSPPPAGRSPACSSWCSVS